ncbi:MAG: hypothetical protein F6K31_08870 [Symploca sp. SIO2G7]|nr:hypothetical protein [Symploca sp. SIO2G7]
MSNQNILLMTATITPPTGISNLKRTDPKIRIQDYEKALKFYLSLVDKGCDKIIFAENSNSDIASLRHIVQQSGKADRVEFIVFNGLDYPPHYNRGYGEFKLLDYAMENSQFIQSRDIKTIVWKVTGRYIVRNLSQIIASQPANFDIYCNFRNFPRRWTDTFLMAWTPDGYQACLKNVYHKLKEVNTPGVPSHASAEELLRDWLDQQPKGIKFVRRLRTVPQIDGVRGLDNKGYSSDNLWKFYVRVAIQKLLPWLWI